MKMMNGLLISNGTILGLCAQIVRLQLMTSAVHRYSAYRSIVPLALCGCRKHKRIPTRNVNHWDLCTFQSVCAHMLRFVGHAHSNARIDICDCVRPLLNGEYAINFDLIYVQAESLALIRHFTINSTHFAMDRKNKWNISLSMWSLRQYGFYCWHSSTE